MATSFISLINGD